MLDAHRHEEKTLPSHNVNSTENVVAEMDPECQKKPVIQ